MQVEWEGGSIKYKPVGLSAFPYKIPHWLNVENFLRNGKIYVLRRIFGFEFKIVCQIHMLTTVQTNQGITQRTRILLNTNNKWKGAIQTLNFQSVV